MTWRCVQSTCVLETDFGLSLNCGLKKSGMFRVRNLGGLKGYVGLGKHKNKLEKVIFHFYTIKLPSIDDHNIIILLLIPNYSLFKNKNKYYTMIIILIKLIYGGSFYLFFNI